MLPVKEPPEGVLNPVRPHLHQHEKVPVLLSQQGLGESESSLGHLIYGVKDCSLFACAEVFYVQDVSPGQLFHLLFKPAGKGVCDGGIARQEAADKKTVYRFRRVSRRDAQKHGPSAPSCEDIPDTFFLYPGGVHKGHLPVVVPCAVPEAVDTETAGVSARYHRGPGRAGDGWYGTLQLAVYAVRG